MEMSKRKGQIYLPALRAQMGDWVYYISFMNMKDIARRIDRAQSFYSSEILEEILQRDLSEKRVKKIKEYLETQDQRFFDSLVIGTYGGDPQWKEFKIKPLNSSTPEPPDDVAGTIGFLVLDGTEHLFAIDGQHRVEGIKLAIKENPNLETEDVSVIFVPGITKEHRKDDPSGFERTRRLFTTLNRYAKPVSKMNIIALDEDDAVAIVTRRLIESYPLFSDKKLSLTKTSSMPPNDQHSFTIITTLYDALDIYLRKPKSWDRYKRFYPGEEEINELYNKSVKLWDSYCEFFDPLKEMKENKPDKIVARKYRNPDGGHFLFRPICLIISVKLVRRLMDKNNLTLEAAVERISRIPSKISDKPWVHMVWNPISKRMIMARPNRRAIEELLFNALGGDLGNMRSSTDKLRKKIAAILDIDSNEVELPSYVN